MATIIIKRTEQISNRFRQINIYLNNEWVAQIAHAEEKELELNAGIYELRAKIDWVGSETIKIEVNEDSRQVIELGCNAVQSLPQILFTIASLTILLVSVYQYGEIKISVWLVLLCLWFLRDVVLSRGKSFLYYLSAGRNKYLYLKTIS